MSLVTYDAQRGLHDPEDFVEEDGVGVGVGSEGDQHRHHRRTELLKGLRRTRGAAVLQGRVRLCSSAHRGPAALSATHPFLFRLELDDGYQILTNVLGIE